MLSPWSCISSVNRASTPSISVLRSARLVSRFAIFAATSVAKSPTRLVRLVSVVPSSADRSAIAWSTSPSFSLISVVNRVSTSSISVPNAARPVAKLANTPVGGLVSSPGLPIRLVRLVSVVFSSADRSAIAWSTSPSFSLISVVNRVSTSSISVPNAARAVSRSSSSDKGGPSVWPLVLVMGAVKPVPSSSATSRFKSMESSPVGVEPPREIASSPSSSRSTPSPASSSAESSSSWRVEI